MHCSSQAHARETSQNIQHFDLSRQLAPRTFLPSATASQPLVLRLYCSMSRTISRGKPDVQRSRATTTVSRRHPLKIFILALRGISFPNEPITHVPDQLISCYPVYGTACDNSSKVMKYNLCLSEFPPRPLCLTGLVSPYASSITSLMCIAQIENIRYNVLE